MLHQPFGRACGPTDTHNSHAIEPLRVYFGRAFNEVTVRVYALTLIEQHLAVAALAATNEEDKVVAAGEGADVWHTVGHLSADGVEALENGRGRNMRLYVANYVVKLIKRLCRLRVKVDVFAEIQPLCIVNVGYDYGHAVRLPNKSQHLSVAGLAEDYYLRISLIVVLSLDAALQLQHHGACRINYVNVVLPCEFVCFRWFSVRPQQHFHTMQLLQVIMVDGYKSHTLQAFAFHPIVNDVAEAIQSLARGKLFLRLSYGGGNAKAEAAAAVNLDV